MEHQLIRPGLMFNAGPIARFTDGVEMAPRPNTTYVVCQDGTIQDMYEPTRLIGWELLEGLEGWSYRVARERPKPLAVYFRGHTEDIPEGRPTPQNAEVSDPMDIDEPEVQSDMAAIANLDPNLAAAAAYVNDPVQTSAMARFARGEMSYAEMRGLCG
jgi:hypothetical protein